MAILESNTDLDVKGRVLATTVPNSTGSIVTWNSTSKVFGLRTNAQIISDLGLTSVVSNSHTHSNKSILDGITSTNISNWNTAFGWGNHSGLYALVGRSIVAGNGLSGGGTLAANRTITLGTPSAITLSSTNSVTTSSHTHALDSDTISEINKGQQALTNIGTLNSLTTTDKSNLVNAINEVNGNIPNVNDFGGVNLVDDSHFYNGNTNGWNNVYGTQVVENHIYKKTFTTLSSAARIERVFPNLKAGVYTLTIFVKTPVAISWYSFVNGAPITGASPSSPTEFAKRTVTFNVPNDGNVTVRGYVPSIPVGSVIEIDWFKLETGYVGSDWTPTLEEQKSDWNETNPFKDSYIKNKPEIPTVNNGQLSLSTGTGLSGSVTFGANQSHNSSILISIRNTHKLPTTEEWNALPTTDTITRLRGTSSGTYTSGDLTLLAGANTTITQSGSNITIASTNTNTTYTAGTGLSLSGTTFGQAITTSGTGTYVQSITQTASGFQVNLGTPPNTNTTYALATDAELASTTSTTARLISGQRLNAWATTKGFLTSVPTMTATVEGTAKLFSATVQSVAATAVSATASRTYGIQKNSSGQLVVNVPWTNTTYSAGTLALLQAGTNTTNRLWSAKILADGLIRKGVHNVNPAGEAFSIYANYGTLDWDGNGFTFSTDHGSKFNYIDDEQAIGVNIYESYGFYLNNQRLRFTSNNINSELLPANGESNSKLPVTGAAGRILAIGATNGSATEYANTNGIINISSLVNQSTGNFVSKSGVNIIDYTGWALDAGVRFAVNNLGIYVAGNASTNPESDGYQTHFEVNVEERFIGMSSGGTNPAGFKIYHNTKGYSNLKAPDSVTTARVIPIGIKQNGNDIFADTEGFINLPTSVSNTTFHNNTHNSTSLNQTVTLTNTSYPRVERIFYGSQLCGTLTIRKYVPVDGDELIIQGRQCTIVIMKSSIASHTIFTPSSHDLVTSINLVNVCHTSGLQSVHLRYMSNYQSWVVLSASITNNGYFN